MAEPMNHEDLVLLHHSGELEAPAQEAFKRHLAACAECQAAAAGLAWGARTARENLLRPPADHLRQVFDRTRPAEAARWRGWGIGLGLAFAAALFLLRTQRGSEPPPAWRNGLDTALSDLERRLGRLDDDLSRDAWALEFREDLDKLSRQQRGLERRLEKPSGA